jgi:hypothetical protein
MNFDSNLTTFRANGIAIKFNTKKRAKKKLTVSSQGAGFQLIRAVSKVKLSNM